MTRNNTGQRRTVIIALGIAGIWAATTLKLNPIDLLNSNTAIIHDFFSRALSPALDYESQVPSGTEPLLVKALGAAWQTVLFAAAATGLSLIGGLVFGFLASSSLMIEGFRGGIKYVNVFLYGTVRLLMTLIRSIHELLWAVLFLAAFGISELAAVIALTLPCTGIFAKIFSELIDETPRSAAYAIQGIGGSTIQVYFFVLIPQAIPDLLAYSFYRFECLLRSSAVLGFFGYPTLGFYIGASFENLYYGEVWCYLYILFLVVALVELWSSQLRVALKG